MARTGKYSLGDRDLIDRIKELEARIDRLERTPQTAFAGVNKQSITIDGGTLYVQRDDQALEGQIVLGSQEDVFGQTGMSSVITRSQAVPTGSYSGDGNRLLGAESFRFDSVDGSVPNADGSYDFSTCNQTALVTDKSDYAILSDTYGARSGMGDPRIPYPAYPTTLITSTSSSFADLYIVQWAMYHPHLQFSIIASNDASTGGEIQIVDLGNNRVITTWATTVGATEFELFSIKRRDTQFGTDTTDGTGYPNGNVTYLSIQFRRSSGAGTARFRLTGIQGCDLSFNGDF